MCVWLPVFKQHVTITFYLLTTPIYTWPQVTLTTVNDDITKARSTYEPGDISDVGNNPREDKNLGHPTSRSELKKLFG